MIFVRSMDACHCTKHNTCIWYMYGRPTVHHHYLIGFVGGKSKGFALVTITDKQQGEKIITTLHNQSISGRNVTVDWFLSSSDYNKSLKGASTGSSVVKSEKVTVKTEPGIYLGICDLSWTLGWWWLGKNLGNERRNAKKISWLVNSGIYPKSYAIFVGNRLWNSPLIGSTCFLLILISCNF